MVFVLNVMELVLFLKMTFKIFASLAKTKSILVIYIFLLHNNQNNKDYTEEDFYFATFASGCI